MRALELGTPGELRTELNSLVLTGKKRATTGLLEEYVSEIEGLKHPGESAKLRYARAATMPSPVHP